MTSITNIQLITKLQGLIDECLKDYISQEEPISILDFPDIRNCGDSAIWLGEIAYLHRKFNKKPVYVSRLKDFSDKALEQVMPKGPIFIHGGGNFGDIWEGHQNFRERIIARFPDRPIIQFPQSIHYQSTARLEETARVIGKHKKFVLLVRDEQSKDLAEKHFSCEVRLCPDMAFYIGPVEAQNAEMPVLAMLRRDKEQAQSLRGAIPNGIPTEDWITESRTSVRLSKLSGGVSALVSMKPEEMRFRMLDAAARNRFQRGIRQISRARAIVTDRLHVHICSLLIGRPHAVLDNSYGKVGNFMTTFSGGTNLSYRARSLEDGVAWAHQQATR